MEFDCRHRSESREKTNSTGAPLEARISSNQTSNSGDETKVEGTEEKGGEGEKEANPEKTTQTAQTIGPHIDSLEIEKKMSRIAEETQKIVPVVSENFKFAQNVGKSSAGPATANVVLLLWTNKQTS